MASLNIYKGTEIKVLLHIDPIEGNHMQDYHFSCDVYTDNSSNIITIDKDSENIKVKGQDDYLLLIDTSLLDKGTLYIKTTAEIPDYDFSDSLRTEIDINKTNIRIV